MKRSLICSILLSMISTGNHAQGIAYSYDASGNRITRTVINTNSQAPQLGGAWEKSNSRNIDIVVGPNPTSGLLSVKFSTWESTDIGSLVLSGISGHAMIQQTISSAQTTIDISTYSDGIYILMIELNGEHYSYKIIKN